MSIFLREADNPDDISRAFEMAYKMNLTKEELLSMDKRVQFASQIKALERDAKESYQKGIEKKRDRSLQALINSGVSESEARKMLNIE